MGISPFNTGNDRSPAPLIAALALVALVPAVGVLWFMSVAMRNERLAVQEQLAAAYANHLASVQPRVTTWIRDRQAALTAAEGRPGRPASEIFAAVARTGLADSAVVYDPHGRPLYPATTGVDPVPSEETELARSLLAQASEQLRAGERERAVAKLAELTDNPKLQRVAGPHGVLIVPDAQLLILKTVGAARSLSATGGAEVWAKSPARGQTLADLVARLNDYSAPDLRSGQRRFLMREVRTLAPKDATFPTLEAEELAAEYLEHVSIPPQAGVGRVVPESRLEDVLNGAQRGQGAAPQPGSKFHRTSLAKVWQLPSADGQRSMRSARS